jgi:hypothetical protein
VTYFQTVNVDSLVISGNVTGGNISTTGNVTAAYFIGNGSLLTGISATANTGNVSFNDVTIQGVTSYNGLNISASPEDTANLKYLRIRSGDADSHIHFDSGNNSQYDIIFGDDSKYLMVSNTGNVVIGTYENYANSWTFGSNGILTFPDAPVQTTAYVPANNLTKVSGTWTVTPGTADYSFTVPINGVYQLWVRANVPNGIISYIATAAVTNTNVPVLGTQRAWNYTGAGSPILFTTLPTQLIGTEGAISTSNPSVGTTTNVFVFGLANSTEENITVQYGYTKIS